MLAGLGIRCGSGAGAGIWGSRGRGFKSRLPDCFSNASSRCTAVVQQYRERCGLTPTTQAAASCCCLTNIPADMRRTATVNLRALSRTSARQRHKDRGPCTVAWTEPVGIHLDPGTDDPGRVNLNILFCDVRASAVGRDHGAGFSCRARRFGAAWRGGRAHRGCVAMPVMPRRSGKRPASGGLAGCCLVRV
jgi:hypothetical protein